MDRTLGYDRHVLRMTPISTSSQPRVCTPFVEVALIRPTTPIAKRGLRHPIFYAFGGQPLPKREYCM